MSITDLPLVNNYPITYPSIVGELNPYVGFIMCAIENYVPFFLSYYPLNEEMGPGYAYYWESNMSFADNLVTFSYGTATNNGVYNIIDTTTSSSLSYASSYNGYPGNFLSAAYFLSTGLLRFSPNLNNNNTLNPNNFYPRLLASTPYTLLTPDYKQTSILTGPLYMQGESGYTGFYLDYIQVPHVSMNPADNFQYDVVNGATWTSFSTINANNVLLIPSTWYYTCTSNTYNDIQGSSYSLYYWYCMSLETGVIGIQAEVNGFTGLSGYTGICDNLATPPYGFASVADCNIGYNFSYCDYNVKCGQNSENNCYGYCDNVYDICDYIGNNKYECKFNFIDYTVDKAPLLKNKIVYVFLIILIVIIIIAIIYGIFLYKLIHKGYTSNTDVYY